MVVAQDHQGQRRQLHGERADLALPLAQQGRISRRRSPSWRPRREKHVFRSALRQKRRRIRDVYIVVADISPAGSMAKFSTEYPERFINVGVAEQSMIGICAGLALQGLPAFRLHDRDLLALSPVRDGARRSLLPEPAGDRRRHGRRRDLFDARRHPSHAGRHRHRRRDPEHADRRALRSRWNAPRRRAGAPGRRTARSTCASARRASRS